MHYTLDYTFAMQICVQLKLCCYETWKNVNLLELMINDEYARVVSGTFDCHRFNLTYDMGHIDLWEDTNTGARVLVIVFLMTLMNSRERAHA